MKENCLKLFNQEDLPGNIMGNLNKNTLIGLCVPLTKDTLPKLGTKTTSTVLEKIERKICGQKFVRAGNGFTLLISNENIDTIVKIVESLKNSGLLIDGATKAVKHEMKKQEGGFLVAMVAPMVASLIAPMAFSLMQSVDSSL